MTPPATSRRPPSARQAALKIIRRLQADGYQALLAGGCVRDMVLGRRPKDYDIATAARPANIQRLFRRTRAVGVQFGVVLVGVGPHWVEVATFRCDDQYTDGRHPGRIRFTDARHDAQRRDFTMNGMFYDPIAQTIIDHVGGQQDITHGVVRAIGEPHERFAEDHLRMLRAIRFAARLGFRIEPGTYAAVSRNAEKIAAVSPERRREELELILTSRSRAAAFVQLADTGLLGPCCNLLDWTPQRTQLTARTLGFLPVRSPSCAAWAALWSTFSPADVDRAARALAFSNELRLATKWLVANLHTFDDPAALDLADLKLLIHRGLMAELLSLDRAVRRANGSGLAGHRAIRRRIAAISSAEVRPKPLIGGSDLMALGLAPGPPYKRVLDRVYWAQLADEVSDRRQALDLARSLLADADDMSQ